MALLEVGRVVRPHGLTGEVVVSLLTNRLERLAPGTVLEARSPAGEQLRLEVLSSRPHQRRHLVRFAGVEGREGAESVRDVVLFAESVSDPEETFVHELIGVELVDQHGTSHGPIRSVEANPASDLLVVDDGLVPMNFVVEATAERVLVEVPDGLFG